MEEITTFVQMVDRLRKSGERKRVVVVCPYDEGSVAAVCRAYDEGVIMPVLIGDSRLSELFPQSMLQAEDVRVVDMDGADECAREAVRMTREGEADVLMKGLINTDNLLRAILDKQTGILPQGNLLTHLSVAQMPGYRKLLFFSDVAVIPYPKLEQRVKIIEYDLATCRRFGIAEPKVALIHFTEKVNPKFPNSVDYSELVRMADSGFFGKARLAGPMDVKTACDAHSAMIKGLCSDVCGDADVLIFPNIESGNTFYKTITLFGGAVIAGVLQGTSSPVILSSRSDSAESKFYSLVLACLNA